MIHHNHPVKRSPEQIRRFYVHYSVMFLLLVTGMFFAFLLTGRSMVWCTDGRGQYFPQMVYLGRYVRELVSNLLHGNRSIRFYDFSIGMGDGILVAARIHRFDLLSAVFPVSLLGVFYTFLVILRLYLAGVMFSAFCRFRKMDDRAVLIGSIVYLSCGFAVYRVPNHPFFASAMVMLPMLLLGAEKIMRGGRSTFFIVSVALSFLVTYYFAYMCIIAVGVYFLLRWLQGDTGITVSGADPAVRSDTGSDGSSCTGPAVRSCTESRAPVRLFFRQGFQIIGAWAVGTGMVSFILVPLFIHLFSSDRVKAENAAGVPLLYPMKYMGNLLLGFISPNVEAGYNTRLNFVALVIPVLVILFFDRLSERRSLRAAILIEFAAVLLPAAGLVMGAFGNISNRWTFIVAFTLACTAVHVIQHGPRYGKTARVVLGGVTALYASGTITFLVFGGRAGISSGYRQNMVAGCVCLVVTSAAILIMSRRRVSYAVHCRVLFVIAFLNAVALGMMTYLPTAGNEVSEYMKWEDLPDFYEEQPDGILKETADDSFYRMDRGSYRKSSLNNSLYHDYYGIAEFNSVMNAQLQQYLLEVENPGLYCAVKITSMDGRAVCENLASVKYYLTGRDSLILPYGFEKVKDTADGENSLYRNEIPLSFAYTYDSAFSLDEYRKLSAARKQQVLMKTVVLSGEDLSSLPDGFSGNAVPETNEIRIPIRADHVRANDRARVYADGFELEKDGTLTFSCNQKSGYECYVRLTGISYEDSDEPKDEESLAVTGSYGTKKLNLRDSANEYYVPMDKRMLYMGYCSEDTPEEIEVKLNAKGRCRIGSVELVLIPMDSYREDVSRRNEGGCANPQISINRIDGDLEEGNGRFVVLPVLYSKGWSAEVDGEPVKLMKANRCYLGFYVPEGAHHFSLTYAPPFWNLAVALTALSWILFAMTLVVPRFRAV